MRRSEIIVKSPGFLAALFFRHGSQILSKCAKIKDNKMEKRFSVRRARAADLDRILAIEAASFGVDAYDRNLFAEYTRKCGEFFLVATGGTKVVGYAITCLRGDRADLVSIAVSPGVRGKGAATALMDSILRRLKRREVSRFTLTVKVTNARAIAFYEKYGFRKLRRVPGYYEDGADGLLLVRKPTQRRQFLR
jgi:ribosomal-protein-alanine N-acetyltransferase